MRSARVISRLWLITVAAAMLGGCTKGAPVPPAERGRRVYLANCITCHNPNPTLAGAAGPPIAGASRALLEAKVLRGHYPPNYTPQRTTNAMVPLPFLASRIDDLAAFLSAAGAASPQH